MDQKIDNISLKFICDKSWDDMADVASGKFCHSCEKVVYDFSDARPNEFLAILAQNNNNICGRFKREQLAQQPVYVPLWKKWISAALILLGITAFNNKAEAQTKPDTAVKIVKPLSTAGDSDKVFGVLDLRPEFPGGIDAFLKFIKDNLRYTNEIVDGKVIVAFIIKKDGTLTNIKAVRGPSEANKAEAVRVLKLSPKWRFNENPAYIHDVSYVVPISFKREN